MAEPDSKLNQRSQSVRIDDPEHHNGDITMSPRLNTDSDMTASSTVPHPAKKPTIGEKLSALAVPTRKVGAPPPFFKAMRNIIMSSWLNLLLIFIPVSWALNFARPNDHTLIFVFSFLAIIPLASLLAYATEEISMRVGQTLAGLLNATLGNVVELIVAIIALVKCELHIVQSSLVGSIMSNLLLVLGMSFFAGGVKFSEQGFGVSASQLNSSLLMISVIAVLLPAAYHSSISYSGNEISDQEEGSEILAISHGAALILLATYGAYLWFQLFSHKELYDENVDGVFQSTKYKPMSAEKREKKRIKREAREAKRKEARDNNNTLGRINAGLHNIHRTPDVESQSSKSSDEEAAAPEMSLVTSLILLVIVTVLVAVTAEWLVDSIDGLTDSGVISKEFVGIILLPIVGNAAEHFTAVTVAVKDKLTLSLGVAVGSSIQIALFVIPFIITLGWIIGKPLTLLFDPLESIVLFFTVLAVNYTVQDGKSNWLEGAILFNIYLILAVLFWFYPGGGDPAGLFKTCVA